MASYAIIWVLFFIDTSAERRIPLCSYDAKRAIGLVRAAERARSPAIRQLFPVTLEHGKGPFLRFCLDVLVFTEPVFSLRNADDLSSVHTKHRFL